MWYPGDHAQGFIFSLFRAAPCFSARPFERSCSCKHSAAWDLTCSLSTGQLVVSDKLPVRRLSAARPEVLNGRMQLRLRHLDQCSAWVKICEVINYGRNKSIGNAPWSEQPSVAPSDTRGPAIHAGARCSRIHHSPGKLEQEDGSFLLYSTNITR